VKRKRGREPVDEKNEGFIVASRNSVHLRLAIKAKIMCAPFA
jgi:hypothetical protein